MDAATWLRLADPIGQGEWIADLEPADPKHPLEPGRVRELLAAATPKGTP